MGCEGTRYDESAELGPSAGAKAGFSAAEGISSRSGCRTVDMERIQNRIEIANEGFFRLLSG
jgi:hypothetical protein